MKTMKNAISILAMTAAFASSAYAADVRSMKDDAGPGYLADPASDRINWSGPYISGQIGYGISSGTMTSTSTRHFDTVPSKCWANLGFSTADMSTAPDINIGFDQNGDIDAGIGNNGPADDRDHVIEAGANASITNVTEQECSALREELGLIGPNAYPTPPAGSGFSVDSGYDPEVPAHDVTTRTKSSLADSGILGGVRLGYDQQFGRVVGGVFGEYNWSGISGHDGQWGLGARAGFLVNSNTLLYALAGYSQTEYDFGFKKQTFGGAMVGGGVEVALTKNVFVGAEYSHAFYGKETLFDADVPGGHEKIDADIDEDRILGRVVFKLN